MKMQSEELQYLITKYLEETASAEERRQVEEWYTSFESAPGLTQAMSGSELNASIRNSFQKFSAALQAGPLEVENKPLSKT